MKLAGIEPMNSPSLGNFTYHKTTIAALFSHTTVTAAKAQRVGRIYDKYRWGQLKVKMLEETRM